MKNSLTSDTSRQCRWPFTNRWLKKSRIRKISQRTKATWSALRLRLDTITCYTSLYTSFLSFWNWKDSHGLLLKFNWSTGNFWYLNSLFFISYQPVILSSCNRFKMLPQRLLSSTTRFDHISPVMKDLHWLPVKYRIMFKLVVYTFKALHGSAPTYIHQLIRLKPQSNYNLRSNTKHLLLDLPNKTKKTTGDRAFFAAAPTLWNALPDELRALGSLKTFMARLKTHYFKLAFTL